MSSFQIHQVSSIEDFCAALGLSRTSETSRTRNQEGEDNSWQHLADLVFDNISLSEDIRASIKDGYNTGDPKKLKLLWNPNYCPQDQYGLDSLQEGGVKKVCAAFVKVVAGTDKKPKEIFVHSAPLIARNTRQMGMSPLTLLARFNEGLRISEWLPDVMEKMTREELSEFIDYKDITEKTAFYTATTVGSYSCMKILHSYGAEIDSTNKHGKTPLYKLVEKGNTSLVQWLVEKGADVNHEMKDKSTPVVMACEKEDAPVLKALASSGKANVYIVDNNGISLLEHIVKGDKKDLLMALVEGKTDLSKPLKNGETPFLMAVREKNRSMVRELLRGNVDINQKGPGGFTAMHLAAKGGDVDMIKFLNEEGANLNVQLDSGKTSLHLASESKKKEAMKTLVELSADKTILDKNGKVADLSIIETSDDPLQGIAESIGNIAGLMEELRAVVEERRALENLRTIFSIFDNL